MDRLAHNRRIFDLHVGGKIDVASRVDLSDPRVVADVYTPGVAQVCTTIANDRALAEKDTWPANTVAVIADGSTVLGLGNIGPSAAMPVMEGKAALFQRFGAVNAIPICLASQDTAQIIQTAEILTPSFGGINLEDISAPRCFEIERELDRRLSIPILHDDQHGTAIVVLAALLNALLLTRRRIEDARIVISGAGAAGVATTYLLLAAGRRTSRFSTARD